MPRLNCTVSKCDEKTKYSEHGWNLNDNTDWLSPPRRMFSEGELQMGCIDLDGTTVGRDGSWSITHLRRSDFIDGPDCYVDRNVSSDRVEITHLPIWWVTKLFKLSSMQIFVQRKIIHRQVQPFEDTNPTGLLPKTIG